MGWSDLAQIAASCLLIIPVWQAGADRIKALAPAYAWITQPQALALGVVAFAAQMAFAARWFRSFHYGPLQWLLRCATRMSLDIPFRRVPQRSPEFAELQTTGG